MKPAARPRVKVCCIASLAEAELAAGLGADALGLVSAMPSGPGVIDEEVIATVAARVPPPVATFLLTSLVEPDAIVEQQRRLRATTLQLVDRTTAATRRAVRDALPGVRIVQVVHVTGPASLDEALLAQEASDALLLDSGNADLAVKELGGTGRVHDWATSARIREAIDVPLFLAGGLRPDNVRQAVDEVGPFGLDVCSGVRTGGRLDAAKLAALLAAAR
ncbi:MAG: phosphoribosylanthranilate isomerase [Vicinamibacteria bacterium]|nr:phosphoribosylanthranilate isomerase [Vicinamibacteria bacterium]MCL4821419.1 phosphoribosylanthranilate isomerase [Vicinamibacteria bacterium]